MTRPINADVPRQGPKQQATEAAKGAAAPAARQPPQPPRARRRPQVPGALKGVAALVVLAVALIVAAIVGGGSEDAPEAPSPAPITGPEEHAGGDAAEAPDELGFPAFATSNTTRVGGSDPAANAAGVALAVYPSTRDALRPLAVVLVEEADWQGAIAASVLMAEPLGAPVLIAAADDLPEPTAAALAALEPRGGADSGGTQAFAVGSTLAPEGLETRRIAARGPAATAAAIAKLRDRLHGSPPRHLVVAPLGQAAFAMPAAAWAARSGDPVLFSGPQQLPKATAATLRRHRERPVYVLGPSTAISSQVVREIGSIGNPVRRVSGEDPVANAIALARYDDGDFGWNVNDPGHGFVVARSDSPPDAAAAALLSGSGTWGPLLLTDNADTLPAALRGYLLDVKPGYTTDPTRAFYNHVWVIGDEEAIDVEQQAEIDELAELARIGEP